MKRVKSPKISKNNSTYILNRIAKEKENERKLLFFNAVLMLIVIVFVSYITVFAVGENNIFEKIYVKDYASHEDNVNVVANDIFLDDNSILKDSKGLKSEVIPFKIVNKKTRNVSYKIYLEEDYDAIRLDECQDRQISRDALKFSLDGKMIKSLKAENYIIMTGSINALSEEEYNLYIWVNLDMMKDKNKSHFHGRLVITEE